MSREQIFGNLRRGLKRGALDAEAVKKLEARIAAHEPNLIPQRSRTDHAGQVALFVKMAEAVSATVSRVADLETVPDVVADYLAKNNLPSTIKMSPDASLDRIPWSKRPLLEIARGRAVGSDMVSVTPCFAAVAETGTLMLTSSGDTPATLNFLPDNHIVVLHAKDVVGAYEEGFAKLRAREGKRDGTFMPRTVNFVTGPSRTADIELTLIMGAHGPRRLHVILVDDEAT
ncbi:MAG TPA: lactate utilization protein [Candidatus Cybelea sp.]|nr:lactate utilization protein [Candidatus Cybelea sp.]